MKIKRIFKKGVVCPFLVCELCNEVIKQKESNGMMFWKDENDSNNIIAHKSCMNKTKNNHNLYPNSLELEDLFFYLLNNSEIKTENSKLSKYEF